MGVGDKKCWGSAEGKGEAGLIYGWANGFMDASAYKEGTTHCTTYLRTCKARATQP